jgi:hypothetical protein
LRLFPRLLPGIIIFFEAGLLAYSVAYEVFEKLNFHPTGM